MLRLFIVLVAWKCVLICLEPFFLDLKGSYSNTCWEGIQACHFKMFQRFPLVHFLRKIPKASEMFRIGKKRNVKSTVDLLALKIFDSVQEWTFLDPDWLAMAYHFVSFYDKNPHEIQSKFDGFCTTFLSLPSIISLLW